MMDRVFALGSIFAVGLGRLLLSYNFLSTISTPLLLSIVVSATTAVFGLAQLWMMAAPTSLEHHSQPSLQHVAYTAIDILFLNFALKDPNLISFVLVQLLSLFFINIMTKSTQLRFTLRNAIAFLIVSFGCYILYTSHFTVGGLPFFAAAIWSVAYADLNSINSQRRNPNSERSHLQSEIFGSILAFVLSLLVWVNNSERLFLVNISTDSLPSLSMQAIAAGALLFGRNRLSDQMPKHSIRETTSTLLVLVGLIIVVATSTTKVSPESIIAAVMFITGAYLTTPAVNESHHNTIQPARSNTVANFKTAAVVGFAFLLLFSYSSSTINSMVAQVEPLTQRNYTEVVDPQYTHLIEESKYNYDEIQYDISPEEIARQEQRYQCLHKTRQHIIKKVTDLIVRYANYTAMDYAYNYNINDAVVWLGQEKLWHIYGQFPARFESHWELNNTADLKTYRDKSMKNGTIFITGGGTMNDELADRADLKTQVAFMFSYNPVVIMPDIITYSDLNSELFKKQVEVFNSHEKLTVLLQDQESIDLAKKHFTTAKVMWVPDTTWVIGPMFPNSQAHLDILLLFRRDSQGTQSNNDIKSMIETVQGRGYTAEAWDFPFKGYPVYQDNEQVVWYNYSRIFPNRLVMRDKTEENMDIAPEYKMQIAVSLFSRFKIIVTDRLHATIIANLIDKPVVFFNEKSGKNELVRKQLTTMIPECSDATLNMFYEKSAKGAVKKAIEFVGQKRNNWF